MPIPINNTPVFTGSLSSQILTITANDNVKIIAISFTSGVIAITGGANLQTAASSAINVTSSNPNITIGGEEFPINYLKIDASAGVCQVVAYY